MESNKENKKASTKSILKSSSKKNFLEVPKWKNIKDKKIEERNW
jgi:hypothetical protein